VAQNQVPILALVVFLVLSHHAHAQVQPFGILDCTPQQGVRFCPGSIATRVKTFDGVPLDVDVTLPATGNHNLPLVIQLHGWGGRKGGLAASLEWAAAGYAVINYTARGFGDSCGSAASRAADPQGCAAGWIHLADSRFEVRDSQYLAGLLVDQRLVGPRKIAVTGGSYGGGQSLELATLRDRVRLNDGTLIPWRSPHGRPMRLAAAAPIVPWSDLVHSLTPNGRTLDYVVTSDTADLVPFGVMKQSFLTGLLLLGSATGFYAPQGVDASADLNTWYTVTQAGEPYDPMTAGAIADELSHNHSAYYLPLARKPAPTLIANGFTDDLFPVLEAVRYVNRFPKATIAQFHADMGHMRGQNKPADEALLSARIHDWFDRYVKHRHRAALKGVEVLTQTCPKSAPSGGPFLARSWRDLHPGEVRVTDPTAKTIASVGDTLGPMLDPVFGGGACVRTVATDQPSTATYRLPAATGGGYTLLGAPTVIATLTVTGPPADDAELAGRLWDVAPDGMQTLVARALYRPGVASGQIVFQLNANGWHFDPGHIPKLELLGSDAPYGRPSNFPFTLGVSNLELRLPTHEPPDGGQIRAPAPPVMPGA
jgi:hypothetical protein